MGDAITAAPGEPLTGVGVVDLGIWRPAPYATQLLAELGAAVTKVEPPGGDPMRAFPGLYRSLNSRKRVVELDLKSGDGRAELVNLMAGADVVVEGFRPGVAARLGAGPEQARAAKPGIIHCSLSGFGQHGPLADASAHDLNFQSWAGLLDGAEPGGPGPRLPVADLAGGVFAALAVCAALARRGLLAEGAFPGVGIDVSMADVLLTWAGPDLGGPLAEGETPSQRFPAYGTFACADGAVTLGVVSEDPFWHALCSELGLDDLADLDTMARAADGPALRVALATALAGMKRDELVGALLHRGVPIAPVLSRREALAVEHFAARGTVVDGALAHPVHFDGPGGQPQS